jgi:signal transduction histidine kinase
LKRLSNPWRSATSHLIAIYGGFFVAWALILLSLIYWETSQYLLDETEHLLGERAEYFASIDPAQLRNRLESTYEFDLLHMNAYGLFDTQGILIAGNIKSIPPGLRPDGHSRIYQEHFDGAPQRSGSVRIMSIRLRNGYELVLSRDAGLIDRLHVLVSRAVAWGLSLTIIPGLLGGIALSIRPRRRIRDLQRVSDRIMAGDLQQRLPVSQRDDELDKLAGIVNRMLDKVQISMFNVKSVCDNVAHDLRTPLTHLRARLHRIQQQTQADDPRAETIDKAVAETEDLLARFSALLRISELKDENRRAAFSELDIIEVLQQVHGLYEPLAEEKSIHFELCESTHQMVFGDRYLLIEAFSNLVGNAIKFTPEGGSVVIRALPQPEGPRVDVVDSGVGIRVEQREAIFGRFFRGDSSRSTPGFGLGLSIVDAIVRLHGFRISVGDPLVGACFTVRCWPVPAGEEGAVPATAETDSV